MWDGVQERSAGAEGRPSRLAQLTDRGVRKALEVNARTSVTIMSAIMPPNENPDLITIAHF